MDDLIGNVVMPGDTVFDMDASNNREKLIFGPGLRRNEDKIFAMKCGVLKKNSSKVYYVDNYQKRYIPVRGESVIGTVVKKGSDEILVDIGSSEPAVVDLLSFEGATKRNKPNIKVGDIIYGKIIVACKDTEPELVCVNSYGKSVGFGALPEGGFVFSVPLDYCRRLLLPNSPILKRLGEMLPMELAIGMNGSVWLRSTNLDRTMVLVQALIVLEHATPQEIEMMCNGITSMRIT